MVAARRAEHLVKAGARVTTFAAALTDDFRELLDQPNFHHVPRHRSPRISKGRWFASWRSRTSDCRKPPGRRRKGPAPGSTSPTGPNSATSSCRRSSTATPLVIAISTGGASPILGRMLKARLETPDPRRLRPARGLHGSGFREAVARGHRRRRPAAAILGDGARRPDRRTRRLPGDEDGREAPQLRARSNAAGPSAPTAVAAKSIWSAPAPAIPTF